MNTTKEIKPCPNPVCLSDDMIITQWDWIQCYVECPECFYRGPVRAKTEDAVRLHSAMPRRGEFFADLITLACRLELLFSKERMTRNETKQQAITEVDKIAKEYVPEGDYE